MLPNEILSQLIAKIDNVVAVVRVVLEDTTNNQFQFAVNSFKWLRKGKIFTSGQSEFLVTGLEINQNGEFVVSAVLYSGTYATPTSLTIPAPAFFYGSTIMINGEISEIRNSRDKTPMIFLPEYRNVRYGKKTDRVLYSAPVRLFFLDEANYNDWISTDYFPKVIDPMVALANELKKVLIKQSQLVDFEEYNGSPVTKFANFDRNGNIKNLFNDDLSGFEYAFDMSVINSENCLEPFRIV